MLDKGNFLSSNFLLKVKGRYVGCRVLCSAAVADAARRGSCAQNQQPPKTVKEIAQHVGSSVHIVTGLKASALQKLRSPSRAAFLQPFMDQAEAGSRGGDEDGAGSPFL